MVSVVEASPMTVAAEFVSDLGDQALACLHCLGSSAVPFLLSRLRVKTREQQTTSTLIGIALLGRLGMVVLLWSYRIMGR